MTALLPGRPDARLRDRLTEAFTSLRLHDYRMLAAGQFFNQAGGMIQGVAVAWLVLGAGHGGGGLGVVAAAQALPILLLSALGGVAADRCEKRRLLLLIQAGRTGSAAALGVLALTGFDSLIAIAGLTAMGGCLMSVEGPTRTAFAAETVGELRIANATALQEVWVNCARILGPLLAGALIATVGVGWCLVANTATFGATLVATSLLSRRPPRSSARATAHLVEGLDYMWRHPALRGILLLGCAVGAFITDGVALPLLARNTFRAGPEAFATMLSAIGVGALVGGITLAGAGQPTSRRLLRLAGATSCALAVAAVAPSFEAELVVLSVVGFCSICLVAVASSLLQLSSRPEFRGRMVALWSMALIGTGVITGPVAGLSADHVGPRGVLIAMAVGVLAAGLLPRRAFAAGLITDPPLGR